MDFQSNFKQYLTNSQSENEKLTEKEMQDLQAAIDNSKKTVELEKQQREFDRQTLETTNYILESPKSNSDEPSKEPTSHTKQWNRQRLSFDNSISTKKDFKITFQDLPKASSNSLDVLYHPAVFDLPINVDPDFQKYSLKIKNKLLFNYFTKLDKLQGKYARKSLKMAPYPKPILPSNKLKNSTNNFNDDNSIEEITNQTSQSLYVSRAGRQVKRKIYTEEDEIDSDYDLSSLKKNKTDDLDLKITLETPLFTETNVEEKTPSKTTKTKKDDSPWKPPLSSKKFSNRSEEMFDKLRQDEEKRKQQEEEINTFVKSLNSINDDEENDSIKIIQDDESFERIRVIPPTPTRRGRPRKLSRAESNTSFTSTENEKKNSKIESPPKSPVLRRLGGRGKLGDKLKITPKGQKTKEEEASTSKLQKVACPICNKEFLLSEIENHAANCGIYEEIIEEAPINKSSVKTISCELCEKEFVLNSDFEVHVQKCIAAHVSDM